MTSHDVIVEKVSNVIVERRHSGMVSDVIVEGLVTSYDVIVEGQMTSW